MLRRSRRRNSLRLVLTTIRYSQGAKGRFFVKLLDGGEELHKDMLGDIFGKIVATDNPIRSTQHGQPVKFEENFQPSQVSILTPKYGLPLPWRRQMTIYPCCDTNSLIKYYP